MEQVQNKEGQLQGDHRIEEEESQQKKRKLVEEKEELSDQEDAKKEGSDDEFPSPDGERLIVEPNVFEGVASAYRYKLVIMNEELYASAFNFLEDVDVFSFSEVNKKRAAKKEEWPFDAPMHHPQRQYPKIECFFFLIL